MRNRKATTADFLIAGFLFLLVLAVVVPFINTIAISFSTQREYLNTPLLLIPRKPTLNNYINLLRDKRISIGYLTSLKILLLGLPINLFLTVSLAYGTSRKNYPGKRLILGAILFTMLFNGGILPLYLQMRELHLTNTIWSVILASGINVFYFVLARNYFCSLPEALIESAQLDGAGEWKILFSIILPISKPILATLTLFYMVDRWNEWYNALIFIHDNSIIRTKYSTSHSSWAMMVCIIIVKTPTIGDKLCSARQSARKSSNAQWIFWTTPAQRKDRTS